MTRIAHSKTFKSGNSVAVRIPREFDFAEDVEVEISGDGNAIMIRRTPKMTTKELVARLREIGPPPDGVQKREKIIFPKRRRL